MNKNCKLCGGTYDFRKLIISNGEIAFVGHLSMCNFKIGLAEIHYVFSIVNECEYK